jgi:hypothetical protein
MKVTERYLGPSPDELRTLQHDAVERATKLLYRLPISDVMHLADAIEKHYGHAGTFQSATGTLAVALMHELGVKVRVAEWHVDAQGCCQHTRYAIGSTTRARCGEIGDESWLEAWIA